MREVEVKILGIDRETVENKLKLLKSAKTFEGSLESVFYDFPDNAIATAKNLLRLRRIGDRAVLTFKRFVGNDPAKVRDEYEVSVSGFETMRLILESLGLNAVLRMKKHRTSYKLKNGVRVDLDRYAGDFSHIPDLLEIEGENVAAVHSQAKMLGFQPEDCRPWTTYDLVNYYSAKKLKA